MLPAESLVCPPEPSRVSFGPFTFDRANGLLRQGSREIPLPPRALGVFDLLVARAGTVVPKQELIDTVWKEAFVTDTSLAEAISVLRQALSDDPQSPQYVQTVHRRGYRFVAPLTAIAPTSVLAEQPVNAARSTEQAGPSIGRQLAPWGLAILSLMLSIVAVWQYTHLRTPDAPVVRMRIEPARGTAFDTRAPALALSPDGLLVAWSACDSVCRLYVRPLDQLDPRAIAGTDGASAPFFSYDGRWIGFFAAGKLQKVAVAGGMPVVLTDAAQPFGAVWLPDGHVVFAASEHGGLMRVSESGGGVEPLTLPSADAGEVRHCWPALAPDDRALMFTIATAPHDEAPSRIARMNAQGSGWQTIIENADLARAASPDYVAFSRANEIHAVPFDRVRQAIAGADQTVIDEIAPSQFAVSRSGAVVYSMAQATARPSLMWIPTGSPVASDLAALQDLTVTSDGARIAGVSSSDIWVGDVGRGTTTRLTHGGTNVTPVWSGDGTAVYYAAANGGAYQAWMRDSSGTEPARPVRSSAAQHRHIFPSSISRDGKLLAYTASGGPTRGDVKVVNLATGATLASIETPFDETNGVLSPDGRLLAYQSDESGRWEIYVLKLSDRQRVPVSSSGGTDPRWSPDGSTIIYRGTGAMRVTIDSTGRPVSAPTMVPLSEGFVAAGVSAGNRILARRPGDWPSMHAALTLQWARDLHRILGPPAAMLPR